METEHQISFSENKIAKALILFLIVFMILNIDTALNGIIASYKSVDGVLWPIVLFVGTTINFLVALFYMLITAICALPIISYRYTFIYTSIFVCIIFILTVLFYYDIDIPDETFYVMYGLFLLFHFLICLIRKKLIF